MLHFGLGNRLRVDSVVVQWANAKRQVLTHPKADTTLTLRQADAVENAIYTAKQTKQWFHNEAANTLTGNCTHHENDFIDFDKERLIPKMLSTEGPKLATADVNGDGLEDFFMGSASGDTAKIFIQLKNGTFSQVAQPAFIRDRYYEDAGAAFLDADGDGDADLVVASGGNEAEQGTAYTLARLYLNDGKGLFSREMTSFPEVAVNASCVAVADINNDGRPDIFIGARSVPGRYGEIPASALLLNTGNGHFANVTASAAPDLLHLGMVTAAQWLDGGVGKQKTLVVAGDWMPVTFLEWSNNKLQIKGTIAHSSGWWNSLQVADVNNDGAPDLLGGNFGLNSRIKPSAAQPASLYVGDFDNNGQTDCIPVYYKKDGKAYPYNLKGELQAQLPYLKKQFLHFKDYASKTINEILTPEQLQNATVLKVEQPQTCVFINDGKGNFAMQPLPMMAQFSPVFGMLATDLNQDGITDMLLGGNFYGFKPQTGRMDASYGTALLGDAQRRFRFVPPSQTGLYLDGEIRDLIQIKQSGSGMLIIVAVNDAPLKVFAPNK